MERRSRLRRWILAGLLVVAMAGLALQSGEIEQAASVLARASLAWVGVALLLQLSTFAVRALAWRVIVRAPGRLFPALLRLNLAKHLADQAVPSGGLGGTILIIQGLTRRHVERRAVMSGFVLQTIGSSAALVLSVGAGLAALAHLQTVPRILWLAAGIFLLVSLLVVGAALALARGRALRLPGFLARRRPVRSLLDATGEADPALIGDPRLLGVSTLLNLGLPLLEAATVWAVLQALGVSLLATEVLVVYVVSMLARNLAFLPSALGTFDAAAVAVLVLLGVGFGTALAATLLARGVLLWLPLIPAAWALRREMRPISAS